VDELRSELDRRLFALRCLPPPTRRCITTWARAQTDPHLLRGYLEYFLVLSELVQSAAGPALNRLCDELSDEESEHRVLARFGAGGDYNAGAWLTVETRQPSEAEQAYCTANVWALILPDDADALVRAGSEARDVQLHLRFVREGRGAAVRWAEAELGLTAESYSDPAALGAALHPLLERDTGGSTVRFIARLGERLNESGRARDAAALLTALLPPIEGDLGARLNHLRAHLAQQVPNELPPGAAPELVGRFRELRETLLATVNLTCAKFVEVLSFAEFRLDRDERGLALIAAFLNLWPEPGAALRSAEQLRRQLPGNTFRSLILRWVGGLHATGHLAEAVEATLRLFTDPEPTDVPAVWLGSEAATAGIVLDFLSVFVGAAYGPGEALTLLCTGLSLSETDFGDATRLRALFARRFACLDGPIVLRLAGTLHLQLLTLGRPLEAIAVMEEALGLDPAAYTSSDTVRAHLRPYWSGDVPARGIETPLGELVPMLRLAHLLHLNGRGRHALRLLFALNPDLCRSWDIESYARIRAWLADFPPGIIDEFVTLLSTLCREPAPTAAHELLTAHLELTSATYADPPGLAAALHARRRRSTPTSWVMAVSGLIWSKAGRAHWAADPAPLLGEIVALGEAALGLSPGWYRAGAALTPPAEWDEDGMPWRVAGIELAAALAWALVEVRRTEDALVLLDASLRRIVETSFSAPEFIQLFVSNAQLGPERTSVLQLVPPLVHALKRSGRADELFALARALAEAPDWFRPGHRSHTGLSWLVVDSLLPVLSQRDSPAALSLARAFVPAFRAFGLRGDVTGIDRVELIRFTQDVRHHLIQTGYEAVTADPSGGAALRLETLCWDAELGQLMLRERFDRQPPRPDVEPNPLPPGLPFTPEPGEHDSEPAVALRSAAPAPPVPPVINLDGAESAPTDTSGITPEVLARALGPDERLLRVGFTTGGQLVWTLFTASPDHRTLCVVCDERSTGTPTADARARVTEAVREHDGAIDRAWTEYETGTRAVGERFARMIRLTPRFAEKLRQQLNEERARRTEAHRAALDAATYRLLESVSTTLNLGGLADLLTGEHDLIVQVDDVLHALPFAFLTVRGRYLFECVRSVRVSLSLTVDDELAALDAQLTTSPSVVPHTEPHSSRPPRVVGLSWFGPGPEHRAARHWARRFHQDFAALAAAGGLEYHAAGESPPGSHAALAAELATGGAVRVLAVLGHGSESTGVELADGGWTGAELCCHQPENAVPGCDLSSVEFLIQVSCSVGRIQQTGARDVDGFCANLVVGRVRSAVAGLWVLFAEDAAQFAVDLAQRYLAARSGRAGDHPESAPFNRPRAQALADARRAWRSANPDPVPRALNTVAAFELYGRG
jgi:hypothetical protein